MNAGQNVRLLDLAVTCSGYETEERVLEEPVLLVEILSPSNQAETWSNIWTYISMPSVQEIPLSCGKRRSAAQLMRRNEDGTWPDRPISIEDVELTLESLDFSVPSRRALQDDTPRATLIYRAECRRRIGETMAAQGEGSVVNVSSVAGHVGLRRSVPLDWAPRGVRVNCLAPGYFETDLTAGLRGNEALSAALLAQIPQGHYGTDRDLVGAAVFVASPASAYVTGQSLRVDGGWTAQ